MGVPLKFPEIRWFPASGKFQPQPRIGAEVLIGAPDFHPQWAAALFNCLLYEKLNAPVPAYAEQARVEARQPNNAAMCEQVKKAVDEFIRVKRLVPLPKQEVPVQPQMGSKVPEPALAGAGSQGQQPSQSQPQGQRQGGKR